MVGTLSARNGKHRVERPLVIELAGPAGVGKSTLTQALARRVGATPRAIWGLPVLPLLGNGIRLLPTLTSFSARSRSPLWDEARHIVRLRTLHRALLQPRAGPGDVVVFDEGPVFALAWLRGFGHETLRSQLSEGWWQATLGEWGRMVDAVVVLEAPDSLLARRIRDRPEPHEVKELADATIARWMTRFREALDWVLAGMTRGDGRRPVVLRLSTEGEPAERLAEQLQASLEWTTHGD